MPFKDIYHLELCRPFCSAVLHHLCKICTGLYEEHVCAITLKFGPVVQEKILFKDMSYLELDKCIVLRIGTLTRYPLCRESHPLCRLKNPTVI